MNKKLILITVFIFITTILIIGQSYANTSETYQYAQDAYKVYLHKKNSKALSLAYANIKLAINENPKAYERHLLAGLILNSMKNNKIAPQLALQHFDKAIELNSNDGALYYTVAQALNSTNKSRLSIDYYEKALWLDKQLLSPNYTVILTDTYIKTNQASRGAYFFENYIKKHKDLPAYFILTAAYLMQMEYRTDSAKEYLTMVIEGKDYSVNDKARAVEMLEGLE